MPTAWRRGAGADDRAIRAGDERKRIERRKLDALLGYCESTRCRRQVLLAYFGESIPALRQLRQLPGAAGDLGRHRGRAEGAVLRLPHRPALRRGHLIDVLRGKRQRAHPPVRPRPAQHLRHRRELDERSWRSVFRQLVAARLLDVDIDGYGGLRLRYGEAILAVLAHD
jgi:ATP-dependent DNA helicase RecQ